MAEITSIIYTNIDSGNATVSLTYSLTMQDQILEEYYTSITAFNNTTQADIVFSSQNHTPNSLGTGGLFEAHIQGNQLTSGVLNNITYTLNYGVWAWIYPTITELWYYAQDPITLEWKKRSYEGENTFAKLQEAQIQDRNAGCLIRPSSNADKDYSTNYPVEDITIGIDILGVNAYLYNKPDYTQQPTDSIDFLAYKQKDGNLYTHPGFFYFGPSYNTGTIWRVADGITSILPNLYQFNNYATAWKRWKTQYIEDECTALPTGRGGNLTAAQMNAAHAYLGTGKTYIGASTGETDPEKASKVSAEMFKTLEQVINTFVRE